jgi:hypothetical protein
VTIDFAQTTLYLVANYRRADTPGYNSGSLSAAILIGKHAHADQTTMKAKAR